MARLFACGVPAPAFGGRTPPAGDLRRECAAASLLLPILVAVLGCGGPSAEGGTATGAHAQAPEPAPVSDPPAGPSAEEMLASMDVAILDPTDEERVRDLSSASAPRIYLLAAVPLMVGGNMQEGAERTCPARVEEGGTVTLRGGCVDEQGIHWTGEAVIGGMNQQQRTGDVTYRVFGFQKTVPCEGGARPSAWQANGTFHTATDGDGIAFAVDIAFQGDGVDDECQPLQGTGAVQYEGRQVATGNASRWSGEGTYGWEGFGKVTARTDDELVNQQNCRKEALMGTTVVRGREHTVTFRYDGERDCDEESTVTWSFDDQPQGELSGVACAVGRGDDRSAPIFLLLVATVLGRRRLRSVSDRDRPRRRSRGSRRSCP